ncbi:MAG: hypothetical protein HY901_04480 [Deltaproteobacteria bacterium]|nr:hypothetical protein [Deltaproteobacteria bacterium]
MATLLLLGALAAAHPDLAGAARQGAHWRFSTERGAVYAWHPGGLESGRCAVVVYVHGYYVDVGQAWEEHRLEEQFAASGIDAVFVAPEAPSGNGQPVSWPRLSELLETVYSGAGIERCRGGPVVAVGHSGAFRTIASWLDEGLLCEIVLIDALYARELQFERWLRQDPSSRRLIVVADLTRAGAGRLAKRFPDALRLPRLRAPATADERRAPLAIFEGAFGHFALITEGTALPLLLSWSRLST